MSADKHIDVVCGMSVNPQEAPYQYSYQNQTYFFCSQHCLENFKNDPEKYLHFKLQEEVKESAEYTCPMHPEVMQGSPGNCPICGMALEPKNIENVPDDTEYRDMLLRLWIGGTLAITVLISTLSPKFPHLTRFLQFILSTPVVLWAGWPFFERGWQSLLKRSLNMFSLISLGVGVAYLYSVVAYFFPQVFPSSFLHAGHLPLYFETAAMIIVLVLLGQVLELKGRSQTSLAIRALLDKSAKSARLVVEGQEQEIPVMQVKRGDILKVRPGDKIPVDGKMTEGTGLIDESMITGEPLPVEKLPGSLLIGSTLNQAGSFLMQAEKVGRDTLLARIVQMVAQAQRSRAPIQSLVDKVSSYFVPLVVLIALITFIMWAFLGPEPSVVYGLVNAIAVLIIACPCALGLATPMSIMVGMGRGAQAGILIKNAQALEKLEKVKTVIIDKTGTLTAGKPALSEVIPAEKENELLRFAAAVEENSEHPLALPIVQGAKERFASLPKVLNFQSTIGGGVSGQVEDHEVLVGKLAYLKEKEVWGLAHFEELAKEAQTAIFVAIDGQAAGLIKVSDPIKPSTPAAIQALHQLGQKIIMLSGDSWQTAKAVAATLGIDEIHAEVEPQYKQDFVKQAKKDGGLVAMAGDGINDAPALAAADVGIAMGTGTDVAMESADVTLVKGDLMGIAKAIHLSHYLMRNIRQNLFFAFIYNVLSIPIAAGLLYPWTGLLLNPMIAALAMSLSSISVILNALRLQKVKL